MVRTQVGYAGGTTRNPTYTHLGDHTETIRIEYDPTVVSYRELLDVFWRSHNPTFSWSRQYMSIIFVHTEEQQRLAEETRDREAERRSSEILTEIVPAGVFTSAEDYHQKHVLRQHRDLFQEYAAIFPDSRDLVASTAVARVNGYLGGHGSCAGLQAELGDLGLSVTGQERLQEIVCAQGASDGQSPIE